MDIAIIATVVAISLALPAAMIIACSVFLWHAAKQFAPGTSAARIARVIAILVIVCCVAWTVYFTVNIYRPFLVTRSGEGMDALVVLIGPAFFGMYAVVTAFIIGSALWITAKLRGRSAP